MSGYSVMAPNRAERPVFDCEMTTVPSHSVEKEDAFVAFTRITCCPFDAVRTTELEDAFIQGPLSSEYEYAQLDFFESQEKSALKQPLSTGRVETTQPSLGSDTVQK